MAPVRHWGSLFHGARKAVLCWLTYPLVLLLGIVMAILKQSIVPLAIVIALAIDATAEACFRENTLLDFALTAQGDFVFEDIDFGGKFSR